MRKTNNVEKWNDGNTFFVVYDPTTSETLTFFDPQGDPTKSEWKELYIEEGVGTHVEQVESAARFTDPEEAEHAGESEEDHRPARGRRLVRLVLGADVGHRDVEDAVGVGRPAAHRPRRPRRHRRRRDRHHARRRGRSRAPIGRHRGHATRPDRGGAEPRAEPLAGVLARGAAVPMRRSRRWGRTAMRSRLTARPTSSPT